MSLANRLHAFLHPLDAVQAQVKLWNTQRHLWTEKYGHLLVSDLENFPEWVVHEGGKGVTFVDEWRIKATGEVVSRAVHVYDQSQMATTSTTVAGDVK